MRKRPNIRIHTEDDEVIVQTTKRGDKRKNIFDLTWKEIINDPDALGTLWAQHVPSRPFLAVEYAKSSHIHQGIGTRMYEVLYKWSCKRYGKPIASDISRSKSSDTFWNKQVKKGRAKCTKLARGGFNETKFNETTSDDAVVYGRSGCERFVMNSCPAPKTLGRSR